MRYLCSLPNVKGEGPQFELFSADPGEIDAFTRRHDVPGRAVYCCINPLVDGATRRCLETVARIERLPFDLDFKDLVEIRANIDAKLRDLPLEPTAVIDSGGGRHVSWDLREPVGADDPVTFERVRTLMKELAAALSADPAPAHPAALLRVVGTHNTKRDAPVLVRPLWGSGRPVDLTELETLLELLPASGLFERKARTNGAGYRDTYSATGSRPAMDVGARLNAMAHHGAGDASVHQTLLQASGALLRQGLEVDFVVQDLLRSIHDRIDGTPAAKDWKEWDGQTLELERMCYSLIAKDPTLASRLPDGLRKAFERRLHDGQEPYLVYRHDRGWHVMSKRGEGIGGGPGRATRRAGSPSRRSLRSSSFHWGAASPGAGASS